MVVAVWQFLGCSKISDRTEATAGSKATVAYETAHRQIYRYSVIPGGAYSGEELARARRIDPVVAMHYADFGDSVHVQRLTQDELVYISYRKQNKVYWTKKKHRVCQGEAILTDGKNQARTRCGNRLSKTPMLPVGKTEPTVSALNGPDVPPPSPAGPAETGAMPGPGYTPGAGPGNSGAGSPVAPVERPNIATGASPGLGLPLSSYPAVLPYFGGGPLAAPSPLTTGVGTTPTGGGTTTTPTGGGTTTPPTGGGTTTPIIPATPVPEPASLLLFLLGGVGLMAVCLKRLPPLKGRSGPSGKVLTVECTRSTRQWKIRACPLGSPKQQFCLPLDSFAGSGPQSAARFRVSALTGQLAQSATACAPDGTVRDR